MKKILTLAVPMLMALAFVRPEAKAWDIDAKYNGPKTPTTDTSWHPDILPGYEARYVDQGEQFDGPCRSTIVRLKCRKPSMVSTTISSNRKWERDSWIQAIISMP